MASTSTATITSEPSLSLEQEDINTKMKIASNILLACQAEGKTGRRLDKTDQPYDRVRTLTKVERYLIFKAKSGIRRGISLDEWNKDIDQNLWVRPSDYKLCRSVYVDTLLVKKKIPVQSSLLQSLKILKLPGEQNVHLEQCGFVPVKIPNTETTMVIETPVKTRKRFEYLLKMAKYRSQGINIIYIDDRSVHMSTEEVYDAVRVVKFSYCIMVASKQGIKCHSYYSTADLTPLKDILLPIAKEITPSVFVMTEKGYHEKSLCELPTPHSTKEKMSNFLKYNNIPHDADMPKAELYSLVQRYKHKCTTEVYPIDLFMKEFGHTFLRCPFGLSDLSFFKTFWDEVSLKISEFTIHNCIYPDVTAVKSGITQVINAMSPAEWEAMEDDLIVREKTILTEDVQIEEIIDSIMRMAKDGKLSEKDFEMLHPLSNKTFGDVVDF